MVIGVMAEPSLVEGTIVGRYEIRSLIGAGGMGEVYLGRDRSLDRPVALKILPQDLVSDSHRVQRFLTEARAASALNHPAIVTIHDSGEERLESGERIHYIAMELVEGVTLARTARHPQPLRFCSGSCPRLPKASARRMRKGSFIVISSPRTS